MFVKNPNLGADLNLGDFTVCCANFITIGEPPIVLYIYTLLYNIKTIIVIISKNKSKIKKLSGTKCA